MCLILSVLLGALAGCIAGRIMHSRGGFARNALLGTLGGAVGAFLFGRPYFGGLILNRLLIAVVGACILIFLVRLCRKIY